LPARWGGVRADRTGYRVEAIQVIGAIRIAEDDGLRRVRNFCERSQAGGTVPTPRSRNDVGTGFACDLGRAILAAIISDNDLGDPSSQQTTDHGPD